MSDLSAVTQVEALRRDMDLVRRGVTLIDDDDTWCVAHHRHDDEWPKAAICWTSPLVNRLLIRVDDLLTHLGI